ncbi:MAG: type IX secretion system protein PorQ [Prolixibacteraceae bacterium]|jgi:hypothetical protein|nr:type IX secretion system protein PorQ [Prolixibacteraceae bacterium]
MMKYIIIVILSVFVSTQAFAQFGGDATYDFLNTTSSARVNALGGIQVGMIDSSELSFTYYNPAMLMPGMHNDISLNYVDYIDDIKIGYASYARDYEGIGTFALGVQYLNYGKMQEALANGQLTGEIFSASDYALHIMYSRNIWDNITGGISIKPIFSHYEAYNSFGIAADLGFSYVDSSGYFSAGIVAKNMGTQITTYVSNNGEYEPLPFDLQAGFSQRLAHAPLRFNVTLQNLTKWNLSDKLIWDHDHSEEEQTGGVYSDNIGKQFLRHVIVGVEYIPTKNFIIGLGYNFQRRWALSVASNPGAVGLSGGFTVKVSKFRVSYAITSYHISSTSNVFSISTNLSEFIR